MNIKQNLGILAQRISRSRNATRTFMMGLNPMPEKVNESSLIQKLVITPLCIDGYICGINIQIREKGTWVRSRKWWRRFCFLLERKKALK
jgi:hypothetical protein